MRAFFCFVFLSKQFKLCCCLISHHPTTVLTTDHTEAP